MYEVIDDTGQVVMIPNIMSLTDETLVDILAWQFHVDFYDNTEDIEFRKRLVQMSIEWHITKGTVKLVQDVLDTYWPGGATLKEWFQYMSPLPPNYPIDNPDSLAYSFAPAAVNLTTNIITIAGHSLNNDDQIRFATGTSATLPSPLLTGLWYRVVNKTTDTFQVALSINGAPIDFLTVGTGTNQIWRHGSGTWHDRYRFRIMIDQLVIQPSDEAAVLELIDHYKPVSRWLEGIFRAHASECDIGWTGMMLRFIYRTSEAPDYP
jgi:P2-related tail formation protein